jgi:hypothetical protein
VGEPFDPERIAAPEENELAPARVLERDREYGRGDGDGEGEQGTSAVEQ